jgi:hypothetical protein
MSGATRAGMRANIANFVRQEINVPRSRPLLPVFEAVSNSLDAIVDRGGSGTIRIIVQRDADLLEGQRGHPHTFVIVDDGIGFNDDNMNGFNEFYSDRKAHKGGKGRGRFIYLKVFQRADINSAFGAGSSVKSRDFVFDLSYQGTDVPAATSSNPIGTRVTLAGMREEFAAAVHRDERALVKDFVSHFLPTLLSNSSVRMILDDGRETDLGEFVRADLLIEEPQKEGFQIGGRDFSVLSVKLRPKLALRHRLILAASSREVRGNHLEKLIPVLTKSPLEMAGESDGFFFVSIVEGEFLNEAVDPMRVKFRDESEDVIDDDDNDDAATEDENTGGMAFNADLFGEPQSIGQVRKEALKIVERQLAPYIQVAIEQRTRAISSYMFRDGMGYHFLKKDIPALAKSLRSTDDRTIETSLHTAAYNERRRRSAQASQLLNASPKEKSEDAYFKKWSDIVDSIGDVAKSDLANYVAHRRVILELISDIIRTTEDGSYRREEVVHSIVFPRGKQTGEVGLEQQNLWLIDERLAFHEHLYSDLTINRITGGEVNATERPDLAIYESGFASYHDGGMPPATLVLVELKQPGRTNASHDDPVSKTLTYVEKLKSGHAKTEGGAVIDIQPNALTTVYILADWTADFLRYLRREAFKEMPGDVGRYLYRDDEKIMFIAMSFSRLIESARRRNRVFFRRLGIEQ